MHTNSSRLDTCCRGVGIRLSCPRIFCKRAEYRHALPRDILIPQPAGGNKCYIENH